MVARLAALDHLPTRRAVTAERVLLRTLEGGCQVPLGALATEQGGTLTLHGLVADPERGTVLRDSVAAPAGEGEHAGALLAARLIDAGAAAILAGVRAVQDAHPVSQP